MKATKITTTAKAAKILAFAAGAVLAGSLMSGTAEAGSWQVGVYGAHAQGLSSRPRNGRSYVKGYLKDTRCDKREAILYIRFGGIGGRQERVYARECGKVTSFNYNSQHRPVTVQACVNNWRGQPCGPLKTIIR